MEIKKEAGIGAEIVEEAEEIEATPQADPDQTPNQRKDPNPIRNRYQNPLPSQNPEKEKNPNLQDPGKI